MKKGTMVCVVGWSASAPHGPFHDHLPIDSMSRGRYTNADMEHASYTCQHPRDSWGRFVRVQ